MRNFAKLIKSESSIKLAFSSVKVKSVKRSPASTVSTADDMNGISGERTKVRDDPRARLLLQQRSVAAVVPAIIAQLVQCAVNLNSFLVDALDRNQLVLMHNNMTNTRHCKDTQRTCQVCFSRDTGELISALAMEYAEEKSPRSSDSCATSSA